MDLDIVVPIKTRSARLKDKNFVSLGGQPLYRWTFDSLHGVADKVLVACNDPAVREEALSCGFRAVDRKLEWDHGTAWDVALAASERPFLGLALVTCPFRRSIDVYGALTAFGDGSFPVVSAVSFNTRSILGSPGASLQADHDNKGVLWPPGYMSTGVIQLAKIEHIRGGYIRRDLCKHFEVPAFVGLDIDTPLDWCAAFGWVEHLRHREMLRPPDET